MREYNKPIMIIDGLNVFMRHYIANPTMSDEGYHVGGVVGFLKNIRLLSEKIMPSKIIVAWEGGGSARRRAIFPDYKKGRRPKKLNRFYSDIPDTSKNRDSQLGLLIEILKHVPVCQLYINDCEADDIIGYMVKNTYRNSKEDLVIVSSDQDLYQLIDEKVTQWSPGQKKFIGVDSVLEKFACHPNNFCSVKSFVGDHSDCIDGIKGVGFKALSKRFPDVLNEESVSVDSIITRAKKMSHESNLKIFKSVEQGSDIARRNWKLMYLDTSNLSATQSIKISSILEQFEPKRDKISIMRILIREGIRTFDLDSFFMSIRQSFV